MQTLRAEAAGSSATHEAVHRTSRADTPTAAGLGRRRRTHQVRPLEGRLFAATVGAALLVVVGVRVVVQLRWGQPSGLDNGNFLALGRQWLGDGLPGGAGSTYPPVVPVLQVALTQGFGPLPATVLLGASASLTYGGAIALVLWRCGAGWYAGPIAVLMTAGAAVGESIAWGGFPQLAAHGMAFAALHAVARLLLHPDPPLGARAGLLLLLTGATSHLVLAEAVAVAVVMALVRAATVAWNPPARPTRGEIRRSIVAWGWVGTPMLLLTPLYLRLAGTVGGTFNERSDTRSLTELLQAVGHAGRELSWFWEAAVIFAVATPAVLITRHREPLWLLSAGLAGTGLGITALSPEPRFAYLAPLLVSAALGLVAGQPRVGGRRTRALVAGCIVVVVALSTVRGLSMFGSQNAFYGRLAPAGTMHALDVLRERTSPETVVATPPVRGAPFGWWVEGYARRPGLVGSSSEWLNFPAERRRAEQAVRLFSATDLFSPRWFALARGLGVGAVFVPSSYEGPARASFRGLRERRPELVIHEDAAAIVVRVP